MWVSVNRYLALGVFLEADPKRRSSEMDPGVDSDPDSDVDVKIQEAIEEAQRKEEEAKIHKQSTVGEVDLDMRMGGKGGPPTSMMPKIRRGSKAANTGPKGVKADYEESKLILQCKNLRAAMRAEREKKKKAHGKTDFSAAVAALQLQKKEGGEDSDEDEDEDDEFFQKYKQEKLELIRNS